MPAVPAPDLSRAPWLRRTRRFAWVLLAGGISLPGCLPGEPEGATPAGPLTVSMDEIHAADGSVLLLLDDIPSSIRVDARTDFGAASRITGASLSPDGAWLAVTTAGDAHGAGWLVPLPAGDPRPAAFQYGGAIHLGPWSEEGRFSVFIEEGPAPSRTLSLADRTLSGPAVSDRSIPVRPPEGEDFGPGTRMEPLEWRGGLLHLELDGEPYAFDPSTGRMHAGG